jgi:hypothetical protein
VVAAGDRDQASGRNLLDELRSAARDLVAVADDD